MAQDPLRHSFVVWIASTDWAGHLSCYCTLESFFCCCCCVCVCVCTCVSLSVCLFVCSGSPALGRAQTLRRSLAHCRSSLQFSSFGTTPRPWGGSLSTEEYEIHSFIYFILSHSLPLLRRWEGGRRPSAPPLDRPYRSHLHATREPGTTPPPTPPVQSNPPTTHLHAQVTATIMINVKIIVW